MHNFGFVSTNYTARLQIYDASTQSWSLGPPLTQLKERSEEVLSAVAFQGCMYVFCKLGHLLLGGITDQFRINFDEVYSAPCHAYCFDPRSNSWSELPPLPINALSDVKACVHDGCLTFAGWDRPSHHRELARIAELYDEPPSTFMYAWDERTETWKSRPLVREWLEATLEAVVSVPLRIR